MSDTKLRCCPFCGGEVEILTEEIDSTRIVYNFHCDNCDMSTYYDYSDREEAVKHWNTRKPIDRIVEKLEEEIKNASEEYWTDYDERHITIATLYDAIDIVKGDGENE